VPPGVPALPGHRRYHSHTAFGVAFISLRDNLDLSTPSGRLMFQISVPSFVPSGRLYAFRY
jgi:hypothetical protein